MPQGGGGMPMGGMPQGGQSQTDFSQPGPWPASMLGNVGYTTLPGTTVFRGESKALPVGEDIYGPFEAGFGAQQEGILAGLGCASGRGYVDGGIDTETAESIVAYD